MVQNTLTKGYSSIDELLIKKYGHTDIARMDFPDWRNKTEFIDKKGKGVSVLTYPEAEKMLKDFLNTPLP